MNFLKQIFLKLANLFGLELQDKQIDIQDDYSTTPEVLPITASISNKLATLTLMDSEVKVIGDSKRATYIDELLQGYLMERISVACEVALGTGDCLIKPYTDGYRIGVDIIKNNDFIVCESIGNHLKAVIIKADEIKQNSDVYQRFETQMLKTINQNNQKISVLVIKHSAFKNGNEIPLHSFKAWENIQEEIIIPNVNQLLFGRIKSPSVNRNDINGVNGVKVTYGLDNIINNVIEAYNRYNQEFKDKETRIFATKSMFETDDNGVPFLSNKKVFEWLKGYGDNVTIDTYSPDIREEPLRQSVDFNLKILETMCGLSTGVLTAPQTQFATATEMKASLQSTFAYITKFRHFIESGINGLLHAIDILANINNISALGKFEIEFDWSTSYIEQLTEQFNRLMMAQSIGAVDEAEVRSFVLDEDYETAKKRVEEISKENNLNEFEV